MVIQASYNCVMKYIMKLKIQNVSCRCNLLL